MRPLTFKETVARDVRGVFLNLDEFADRHTPQVPLLLK